MRALRDRGRLRAALALPAPLLLAECSSSFGMPRGATEQGEEIFRTWQIYVVLAAVVAGIVYGLIVWSVIRYRRRGAAEAGTLPPQFRANVPLEILYTGIPILIVIGLFAASFAAEGRVNRLTEAPAAVLRAEAFAWGWRFAYEGEEVMIASVPGLEPEIALPIGETTRVELTSNDVIHAFYVPEFLFKRDAVPGRTTAFDLTPTRLGTFHGACAEFCGLNHAFMGFTVRVVGAEEFEAWLDERREAAA